MSAPRSGMQPTSFQANVNRAKTKKWVEAKSYSYDGDDWGEVDDYDEYGGYDDPEPAPKPTGLRQRGQSANKVSQEAYEARQDFYQSPIDTRQQNNIEEEPPLHHHKYGGQSLANPQFQSQPLLERQNSFDRDDEHRAFSAGKVENESGGNFQHISPSVHQHTASTYEVEPGMPTRDISSEVQHVHGFPPPQAPLSSTTDSPVRYGDTRQSETGEYREQSQSEHVRHLQSESRTHSMTSNNSALDFNNRRDFSPSAVPPPLQPRSSPSPHGANSSRHPPRKSSLTQDSAPAINSPVQGGPFGTTKEIEEDKGVGRDRASSGTGKALPFVRPADIYRRMHEEKERERQSQESSRPSLDTLVGKPNERPGLGRSQDSESSQRLKPTLDPVSERKSEYGMEGIDLKDQESSNERRRTSSKTFEFPKRISGITSQASSNSLGPRLPDVSRVSGFGESFFGSANDSSGASETPTLDFSGPSSLRHQQPSEAQETPQNDLQHQPSLGFKSAVHQAFDRAEDQVPPTPSSTQGSSIGRSASGGTSTVSPIISRGPSIATENLNSRIAGFGSADTPMIPEGPEGNESRPLSLSSSGTPTQAVRRHSPTQTMPSVEPEAPPPSFIPGYRRNSDTPSPDNSPRRTPGLEVNRQLRHPQEVEIGAATPTDPTPSSRTDTDLSAPRSSSDTNTGQQRSANNGLPNIKPTSEVSKAAENSPYAESPTSPSKSSRVRDLADKFESDSRPGSSHSLNHRVTPGEIKSSRNDDLPPPRPLADRMESFRPQLPGGWESSASIAPAAAQAAPQRPDSRRLAANEAYLESDAATSIARTQSDPESASATPSQAPSTVGQIKDASEEAFAAVAAAGSALAGAFGAAVGTEPKRSAPSSDGEAANIEASLKRISRDHEITLSDHAALHPATSNQYPPQASNDESLNTAPTPLSTNAQPSSLGNARDSIPNPPATPSALKPDRSVTPIGDHGPPRSTPMLPLLSTDKRSPQYESDRLRKEIVRELTPMSASEPTTAESDYSNSQAPLSISPSITRPGHESGVFPREYESYWNDAVSEDEADESNAGGPLSLREPQQDSASIRPLQPNREIESPPVVSSPSKLDSQEKPHLLPHRFSWEQPLQAMPTEPEEVTGQPLSSGLGFLQSEIYPEGHTRPRDPHAETEQASPLDRVVEHIASKSAPTTHEEGLSPQVTYDFTREVSDIMGQHTGIPDGPELAPSTVEKYPVTSSAIDRNDVPILVGDQTPIISKTNQQGSQHGLPDLPGGSPSSHTAHLAGPPPIPSPTSSHSKIPAFREIMALKTPQERIRAFNQTREQFANLNTGLAHWLVVTTNNLPEHADLLASSGPGSSRVQGHRPSPSRSRLAGFLPSGGQSSQVSSQQHLEANAMHSAHNGTVPSSGVVGGPPQGISPGASSGKLSSQQVQAKGKDFLRSAGVVGGRANVAAKGLFSKGKSKLRAASGNEKV